MTQRLALIAAPLLLLAACGPAKQADTAAPPAAAGSEVPKSGPVAIAVTPYVGGPLHVRADGVGPITGETAFDLATIKALFPKAVVKSAFIHTGEGPPGPIITVEQDNVPLLEIGKDAEGGIGEIRMAGGPVEGPKGEACSQSGPTCRLRHRPVPGRRGPHRQPDRLRAPEAPTVVLRVRRARLDQGRPAAGRCPEGQGPAQRVRLAPGREGRRRRGLIRCCEA
jgi:hypothetical protein